MCVYNIKLEDRESGVMSLEFILNRIIWKDFSE